MSNSPSFAGRLLSGWDEENRQWEAEGLRRVRRTVIPGANGQDEIDGRRLWNYGTNDYLGLARHPQVIAAAIAALEKFGAGARSSALIVGRTERHAQLESRLTAFEGSAATLLFPSGYAANSGVVSALATSGDLIFCDRLNHASLVDGCRLDVAASSRLASSTFCFRKFRQ